MEKLRALQKYVRQLRPIQEKYVDHVEQVQDLFEELSPSEELQKVSGNVNEENYRLNLIKCVQSLWD